MPGFNRQGPKGEGPMSGRSMGKCGNGRKNQIDGPANASTSFENSGDQQELIPMFRNRGHGRQRCHSNGGGFGGGKRRGQ